MIEGALDGVVRHPIVRGIVWIERYASFVKVDFRLDLSSPTSFVSATDIGYSPLPLDDIVQLSDDDLPITSGIPVQMLLWFDGDDAFRYSYQVPTILGDGRIRSRLGWDVLGQWTTVIDPESATVLFAPREWDARSPL